MKSIFIDMVELTKINQIQEDTFKELREKYRIIEELYFIDLKLNLEEYSFSSFETVNLAQRASLVQAIALLKALLKASLNINRQNVSFLLMETVIN